MEDRSGNQIEYAERILEKKSSNYEISVFGVELENGQKSKIGKTSLSFDSEGRAVFGKRSTVL